VYDIHFAAVEEIIDAENLMTVSQQAVAEMGAKEAGAAGD